MLYRSSDGALHCQHQRQMLKLSPLDQAVVVSFELQVASYVEDCGVEFESATLNFKS